MIFISPILIALAAICNAFMDATENENFFESILRKKKQSFWYKRESWKTSKKIFGWKTDAWHIFKSLMIVLLMSAAVFYKPILGYWDIILFGVEWNIVFVLFYHKILKVK